MYCSNCDELKAHVCCDELSALVWVLLLLLLVCKHSDGVSHLSGCYCVGAFHRAFVFFMFLHLNWTTEQKPSIKFSL